MKKLFLIISLLITLVVQSQCNRYFIYESFGTSLPTQKGTWVATSMSYLTTPTRTGTNNLTFNGANDALRTPLISNPGVLSFWYRRSSNTTAWALNIQTSPDNTNWTTRGTISTITTTYVQYTLDIGALGLTNVYVRLVDARPDATKTHERYIDDLSLTSTVESENTLIPFLGACSQTLNSSYTYTISDDCGPMGPTLGGYGVNVNRTITLTPSNTSKRLNLDFTHLDLETTYDFLYVYDGPNTSSTLLATLNGSTTPSDIVATNSSGQLTLRWTSDGINTGTWGGFLATVTSIDPPLPNCVSSPTSPTNSQVNVSLTPTLSWSSAANATSYDVYFGNPLPESPTTNTSSTSYSPGTLLGTTTYYWKVVPKNSTGSATGCDTWSFTTLTPVENDDPSTATTLVVNDGLGYKTYTNVNSNNTTTESSPTCASYNGEDVWFKVVVPNNITILDFDTQVGVITDGGMAIYRGTIGSLTQIECDDDDGLDGLMPWIYREDFTPGETIYIRFWEYGGGTTGTFKMFVSTPQPLPVELTQFESTPYPKWNVVKWATASEQNSSHFDLEMSLDGNLWKKIAHKYAAGNSTEEIKYSYIDYNLNSLVYYRLQQFDIDGKFKTYGPIVATKYENDKKIVKYINLLGQEIDPNTTKGIVIEIYSDGTMRKVIK